ncbi:hypothetical protein FAIPA1_50264 [Frankia sp. AiPs1]
MLSAPAPSAQVPSGRSVVCSPVGRHAGGGSRIEPRDQVDHGKHADGPAALGDEILRGGGALDGGEQVLALQVGVEHHAGPDDPAHLVHTHPRPPMLGQRVDRRAVHDLQGGTVAVDDGDGGGADLLGPPQRLGQRHRALDRQGAAHDAPGGQPGQPLAHLGGAQRLVGRERQESRQSIRVEQTEAVAADHRPPDDEAAGDDEAAVRSGPQPAQLVAGRRPDRRDDDPAAVKRQAGGEVEREQREVHQTQVAQHDAEVGVGRDEYQAQLTQPGEDSVGRRTAEGDQEHPAGAARLGLVLGEPGETVQRHRVHRVAQAQRDQAVAEFVGEQGHQEADRDGRGQGQHLAVGGGGKPVADRAGHQVCHQDREDQRERRDIDRDAPDPPECHAGLAVTRPMPRMLPGAAWAALGIRADLTALIRHGTDATEWIRPRPPGLCTPVTSAGGRTGRRGARVSVAGSRVGA